MFSFVAEVTTIFDVLVLQKSVEYNLRNGTSFSKVVADMVCGDKEVEDVVYVKLLGETPIFSACFFKHVPWCSQLKEGHRDFGIGSVALFSLVFDNYVR